MSRQTVTTFKLNVIVFRKANKSEYYFVPVNLHICIFIGSNYAPINVKPQAGGGGGRPGIGGEFDVRSLPVAGAFDHCVLWVGHLTLTASGLGHTDAILDCHAGKHADIKMEVDSVSAN